MNKYGSTSTTATREGLALDTWTWTNSTGRACFLEKGSQEEGRKGGKGGRKELPISSYINVKRGKCKASARHTPVDDKVESYEE